MIHHIGYYHYYCAIDVITIVVTIANPTGIVNGVIIIIIIMMVIIIIIITIILLISISKKGRFERAGQIRGIWPWRRQGR